MNSAGQGEPLNGPSSRTTLWVSRVGFVVLVWILVGLLTGLASFLVRRGWLSASGGTLVLAAHVYLSVFSMPFLASKIWGTWRLLRDTFPGNRASFTERLASAILIFFAAVLYLSGLLLAGNVAAEGNRLLKDLHLYATVALLAPLTWHLYRRLKQAWQTVGVLAATLPQTEWHAPFYSRRTFLALTVAAGLSVLSRWALVGRLVDDPNDFPVTNFGLPSKSNNLDSWRLEVTGDVANPLGISYLELLSFPRETHRYSLVCVTGWSTIHSWEGVAVSRLVEAARPTRSEPRVRFLSSTGYEVVMKASTYRRHGAIIATHVEGVPFTHDHGFPARLMVPEVVGEENLKWLTTIEILST